MGHFSIDLLDPLEAEIFIKERFSGSPERLRLTLTSWLIHMGRLLLLMSVTRIFSVGMERGALRGRLSF